MRFAVVVLVACSSSAQPKPAAPVANATPVVKATHSCADAALGLENATRGVREPERDVFDTLRSQCVSDAWPALVVDCFATMKEGDLGRCAKSLPDATRESVFHVLAGVDSGRRGIAVARARLDQMQVGVPECDRFVSAVATAMTCEGMPVEQRVQLGNETAEFWSLPTNKLAADDLRRISDVCKQSLTFLQQQAVDVGCML